jgi:N6-L-threonylcarbamoyladenine synthase
LIGVNTAQTLSYLHGKPLIPIHHIAGHIYANFLERTTPPEFPILVLTVSGGHNELVLFKDHYEFEVIGETLDDAAGEAFDKVARLLNLGFPGGPIISKTAEKGNPNAFNFPRARLDHKNRFNFSFSGLKTAVMQEVQRLTGSKTDPTKLDPPTLADLAASFQAAVIDVLADKLIRAAEEFGAKEVHLAGGVSANQLLRKTVTERLKGRTPLHFPENLIFCTDNATMIAGAAYFLAQKHPKRAQDFKHVGVHSQLELS